MLILLLVTLKNKAQATPTRVAPQIALDFRSQNRGSRLSLTRTRAYVSGLNFHQNNISPPRPTNPRLLTCLHVLLLRTRISDRGRRYVSSPRPRKRDSPVPLRTPSLTLAGCCSQSHIGT